MELTLQNLLQWSQNQHHIAFKLLALLVIFTSVLLKLINIIPSRKQNLPPSPPTLPIIGNLHQLSSQLHRSLSALAKLYGPVMLLHAGSVPVLVVSSLEMVREIKKNQDVTFSNRPSTTPTSMLLYRRTGLSFSPYGDYWRQVRKVCVTELLSIRRVESFKSIREGEVGHMIKSISRGSSLGPVNLSEMLVALSYNVVFRCVTGKESKGEGNKNFGELLRELMILLPGTYLLGDFFPWLGWVDRLTGMIRKMKKVSSDIDTYFEQVLDEHLVRSNENDLDYKKDFVDHLLHIQKHNTLDINLTRENIKAIMLDMFLGGTDTGSTAMEWAMSELVKNPNVMKKAQDEVRRVVGTKSKVDEDDIQHMHYLKCIVKETLRLHPPAAFLPSECSTNTTLNGYHVAAKTRVIVNVWDIQRDGKSWDMPDEFIPERFGNSLIDFKGHDYELIPFGSGRRGCPGTSFGTAVIEAVIANLLYWFDWELPEGENELDMTDNLGGSLYRKTPLILVPLPHSS